MTQIHYSMRTIQDFIRWGASRFNEAQLFFGHGTDNAIDEAAALVLHTLHLPPNLPSTYLASNLTKSERLEIIELLLKRITERTPAAYLMQRAWFAGIEFYVDERVLIPRSPLAELIENQFNGYLNPNAIHTVLDLGTGSGCIGIATAVHLPNVKVDLTDISTAALEVAAINVADMGLEHRIRIIHSNLFENLTGMCYDLILCNPPYVAADELAALPEEYQHEPALGLAGGDNGLDIVTQILEQALFYLKPSGVIIMEVGNSAETLMAHYPKLAFTWLEFERGGHGVFLLTAEQLKSI
jgi:ribosomal protein L3 glutamine methyltransferase